jgi:hypothetical protein
MLQWAVVAVLAILTAAWLVALWHRFTPPVTMDFDDYMGHGFRTWIFGATLAGIWIAFIRNWLR